LVQENYIGIRPAPGYPACPDHLEKKNIFNLLNVEKEIGVSLTESMAMFPAASVAGYIFANPFSKYFGVGKISLEQVHDFATRKKISNKEAEKWLISQLAY
jgi:5-methyltetrahydrofolate--homocysteine methyltransferase